MAGGGEYAEFVRAVAPAADSGLAAGSRRRRFGYAEHRGWLGSVGRVALLTRRDRDSRTSDAGYGRGRELGVAALAVLLAVTLAAHRAIPNVRGAGNMLDSALPWLGLGVPLLLAFALVMRTWHGAVWVLLPALVWGAMFGPAFVRQPPGGTPDLRVATQNIYAANKEPAKTAAALADTGAGLIAVEEIGWNVRDKLDQALDRRYPHHAAIGTVGLWSRYPIHDAHAIAIGMGWVRAMRAQVTTPKGDVTVYVAHLDSVRIGRTAHRDETMSRLAAQVKAEGAKRLLVLGDLNTATTDRSMGALIPLMSEAQNTAGRGLGLTWPADLPLVRPDHILYRGIKATDAKAVHTPGSDHRAATASFRF